MNTMSPCNDNRDVFDSIKRDVKLLVAAYGQHPRAYATGRKMIIPALKADNEWGPARIMRDSVDYWVSGRRIPDEAIHRAFDALGISRDFRAWDMRELEIVHYVLLELKTNVQFGQDPFSSQQVHAVISRIKEDFEDGHTFRYKFADRLSKSVPSGIERTSL